MPQLKLKAAPFLFCIFLILYYQVEGGEGLRWDEVNCAHDDIGSVPAPQLTQRGPAAPAPLKRFQWLGIVQHAFYLAGRTQYAITPGVLIHPGYVLAAAEDIGQIPANQVDNATNFIVWGPTGEKHMLEIVDYLLHPDYVSKKKLATVALLRLRLWFTYQRHPPIDPICLPLKGMGSFDNLYVIKLNDDGDIKKEVFKMNYVEDKKCEEFYYQNQLSLEKMKPQYCICASVHVPDERRGDGAQRACLWDNGGLLVARLHHAYWTLLGFGVRGPACGAPARFVGLQRMMEWVDTAISSGTLEDAPADMIGFYLRQLSPYKLHLFNMDRQVPKEYGQCAKERGGRGGVKYKDITELITTQNVGQGFYFVAVYDVAMFTCAIVTFETTMRSYTALWVEHNCMRENRAHAPNMWSGPDRRKYDCFAYYKTTAFIEFRYTFSFKAFVTMTLYGQDMKALNMNPWLRQQTTNPWYPSSTYFENYKFRPQYWSIWK